MTYTDIIKKAEETHLLSKDEIVTLLQPEYDGADLFAAADRTRKKFVGDDVQLRGLIEYSNYCRNNCLYCGIRRDNHAVQRYRIAPDAIIRLAQNAAEAGYKTVVLQSGEDVYYTVGRLQYIISEIKKSDIAVTLSIGEKSFEEYAAYKAAGADRYLLRHETYNHEHYRKLHPPNLSPEHRQQCLRDLKDIGYQIGCGFMVGSPYQTSEHLAEDMLFMKELNPHMIGIGPFIPHHDTPFAGESAGTLELTLYMLGLIRLMIPKVLLPATTALGTIHPKGRELGILAGANVVMPNLSPTEVRKDYLLYDNKICTGDESAQCRHCLEMRMKSIGYQVVTDRGDSLNI